MRSDGKVEVEEVEHGDDEVDVLPHVAHYTQLKYGSILLQYVHPIGAVT